MVGRIPDGPHRLAEAEAHLAREIAIHQAKLDRYAGLLAAGEETDGTTTGTDGRQHPHPPRAQRVVEAAHTAEHLRSLQ